jgi:hypothetical protein
MSKKDRVKKKTSSNSSDARSEIDRLFRQLLTHQYPMAPDPVPQPSDKVAEGEPDKRH